MGMLPSTAGLDHNNERKWTQHVQHPASAIVVVGKGYDRFGIGPTHIELVFSDVDAHEELRRKCRKSVMPTAIEGYCCQAIRA